jgi:hypothetical protein
MEKLKGNQKAKGPSSGPFAEPSDGLEPSSPGRRVLAVLTLRSTKSMTQWLARDGSTSRWMQEFAEAAALRQLVAERRRSGDIYGQWRRRRPSADGGAGVRDLVGAILCRRQQSRAGMILTWIRRRGSGLARRAVARFRRGLAEARTGA